MVIQKNEKEFKGKTLLERLDTLNLKETLEKFEEKILEDRESFEDYNEGKIDEEAFYCHSNDKEYGYWVSFFRNEIYTDEFCQDMPSWHVGKNMTRNKKIVELLTSFNKPKKITDLFLLFLERYGSDVKTTKMIEDEREKKEKENKRLERNKACKTLNECLKWQADSKWEVSRDKWSNKSWWEEGVIYAGFFDGFKGIRELDLKEYPKIKKIGTSGSLGWSLEVEKLDNIPSTVEEIAVKGIKSIPKLNNLPFLTVLSISRSNLNSIDFLNTLPNPEKLKVLKIYDNNIRPTTLEFLRPFVNLEDCKLGENASSIFKDKKVLEQRLKNKTYNKFYGSLEPIKNLTKLEEFCIAGTDVEEGIEYIPTKIAQLSSQAVKKGKNTMENNLIDCQPLREDAKVSQIQNELRPFNYDLLAWQLAHPEKMLISRPEYFTNPDSKDKWINALTDKITNTQQELQAVKEKEVDKVKKIERLESKIKELEQAKSTISQQTQTEFSTQNKSTQTDLTMEQIKQREQTWYQKLIDKIKKN